ncbi:unnamed protein product [Amoebophrya sp. A120]|nr:unnamed protein product [Amoebophrya sp. A120]|eukprot:GSA120T00006802001.1
MSAGPWRRRSRPGLPALGASYFFRNTLFRFRLSFSRGCEPVRVGSSATVPEDEAGLAEVHGSI